jgi:hypothetical protein
MTPRQPAIPLDELQKRYEALGPIEELSGERSYLGRCSDFEGFLQNGPFMAEDLRAGSELPSVTRTLPELAELALVAWPEG